MGVFMKQEIMSARQPRRRLQQHNRNKGFTLIELLVTLSIAAILLGIAVTSFRRSIEQSRFTSAANEILSAMNYARGEALRRSRPVSVSMAAGGWANGWNAFIDPNRDGVRAATELLLRSGNPVDTGVTVTVVPTFVTFDANGRRTSNQATQFLSFEFYKANAAIDTKRTVCITQNGRVSTVKGSATCT
jgi:type IV fimbrial biogenesis protein FimT